MDFERSYDTVAASPTDQVCGTSGAGVSVITTGKVNA
jgi:hypothetical protein